MARPFKDPADRLDHPITCLFTAQEKAQIERTAHRFGISKAAAVRLLVRVALEAGDPITPK